MYSAFIFLPISVLEMSPEYTIPNILKYKQHTVKAKSIFFLMFGFIKYRRWQ